MDEVDELDPLSRRKFRLSRGAVYVRDNEGILPMSTRASVRAPRRAPNSTLSLQSHPNSPVIDRQGKREKPADG